MSARLPVLALVGLVAACDRVPPDDPALEQELDLQLTAAAQVETKFGRLIDAPDDYSAFEDIHDAARPLRQLHTACATRRIDGARVLLVDGRGPIADGPMINGSGGPWFDYAWNKAGC